MGPGRKLAVRRKATAYHEAGHTVVAWRLGANPKSAAIIPHDEVQGEISREALFEMPSDFDGSDHARNRIERAIMICLAEPIAQRHFAPRSWRQWHGAADYQTAFNLALRINGSPSAAKAHLKWLEIRTQDMVKSLWSFVERIADDLLMRGVLSLDEIQSALLPMHKQDAGS